MISSGSQWVKWVFRYLLSMLKLQYWLLLIYIDISFTCLGCITVWASYQICKIVGCACAGNAGNISPATNFKRNRQLAILACITACASPLSRTCCDAMSGSLTHSEENVPGIYGAWATRNFMCLVRGLHDAVCPSFRFLLSTVYAVIKKINWNKKTFHIHFFFGHKIYWAVFADAIENQHHSSLNVLLHSRPRTSPLHGFPYWVTNFLGVNMPFCY